MYVKTTGVQSTKGGSNAKYAMNNQLVKIFDKKNAIKSRLELINDLMCKELDSR